MNFRVAIVGHSNVPTRISAVTGVDIKIYRKPGASIVDAYSEPLSDVHRWQPHLIVLFLGGNDCAYLDRKVVLSQLLELINYYKLWL